MVFADHEYQANGWFGGGESRDKTGRVQDAVVNDNDVEATGSALPKREGRFFVSGIHGKVTACTEKFCNYFRGAFYHEDSFAIGQRQRKVGGGWQMRLAKSSDKVGPNGGGEKRAI